MKIKKGDNIKVLTGKDRGKTGEVLRAFPREDKVIVKGINIMKRHLKNRKTSGIVEVEMPIHVSNVVKIEKTEEKKAPAKKKTSPKAKKPTEKVEA